MAKIVKVIGIKFKSTPKIYFFEAGEHEYKENCGVIVETARGVEFGNLAIMPTEMEPEKIVQPLKPILRLANEKDYAQKAILDEKRPEALKASEEKIRKSGLSMKVVDVEYTFDGSKLIIYFISDGRVDFRDLVKDLASTFKVRIELRQIGVRDECKMLGGLAPCGRACCCSDHLTNLAHVTIKMAKNQNLSLSPTKISGLCGRLMCCLQYENANYVEVNKRMPKLGSEVETKSGVKGKVHSINQLKETINLKILENETVSFLDVPLEEIKKKGKGSALEDMEHAPVNDDALKELLQE